jgi:cytochrome c-type biogenesis protein CcmH/NrfG
MAYQARVSLLQKIYEPVEELVRAGELQRALFKLDELAQNYPSEAHGRILKGEILQKMDAPDEALHSYVDAVRLNGDYLDRKSPLSRRAEIQLVAEEGVRTISARLRANPDNSSLAASLKDVNYLRSRLAGGCE